MSSRGFGFKALMKHKELIPLVSVLTGAVIGATGFTIYSLKSKPDVRLVRSRGPAHEDVEPTDLRKLYSIRQKPEPIPELEALRKEIGSYKY